MASGVPPGSVRSMATNIDATGRRQQHLQVGVLLQARADRQRRLNDQLDLVGQQQALARGDLGHDAELDQRVVRELAPVALEALEDHAFAFAPLLEAVGTGADGLFVEAVRESRARAARETIASSVAASFCRNSRELSLQSDAQRERVGRRDAVDERWCRTARAAGRVAAGSGSARASSLTASAFSRQPSWNSTSGRSSKV